MAFEIRVNGKIFSLWETASVNRSIERNSGTFQFSSTSTKPVDYPIKVGDKVQITIDGTDKITGFVDVITSSGSKEQGQIITVSGRDNIQDIIDSSVPDASKKITTPISMKAFCEKIISDLGLEIKVINTVNDITDFDSSVEISADSGTKCMDFLTEFARKLQVYLVADGAGNLIIYRPAQDKSATTIIHEENGTRNNVLNFTYDIDDSVRYNEYRVTSQDNFGSDDNADYSEGNGVNRKGSSIDDQIRDTRYLEIQGEESMGDKECTERANEQSNLNRAKGFSYSVSLTGSSQNDGTLWDYGLLVPVSDKIVGVNGIYMIKSVNYSVDVNSGTITDLILTRPEAYKVRGEITEQDARIAPTSGQYQKSVPDNKPAFVRKKGGFGT